MYEGMYTLMSGVCMYTLMSGGPIGYYVCMLNVCMINVCMLMCTRRFESQTNNIHKHLYAYFMYCMCTVCIKTQ